MKPRRTIKQIFSKLSPHEYLDLTLTQRKSKDDVAVNNSRTLGKKFNCNVD